MALKANLVFTALGTALGASAVIGALYIIGIMDHHDEPVVVDNPSLRIDLGGKAEIAELASRGFRRKSTTPLERIVALVWSDNANPPQELAIHMARERSVDFILQEDPISSNPNPEFRFERTWVPFLDHADLTSSLNFRKLDAHTIEPESAALLRVSAIRIGKSFYCVKKIGAIDEKECFAAAPPAKVKVCIFPRPEKPEPPKTCK